MNHFKNDKTVSYLGKTADAILTIPKLPAYSSQYFSVDFDVDKFVSSEEGINYVVITVNPDVASDAITGLGKINLFGKEFQAIDTSQALKNGEGLIGYTGNSKVDDPRVDFAGNSFYFFTGDLFSDENENAGKISFDIFLRGTGNNVAFGPAWSITVQTGYITPRGPAENPTPEPATLAIFGLGLVGLGIARRRMSK